MQHGKSKRYRDANADCHRSRPSLPQFEVRTQCSMAEANFAKMPMQTVIDHVLPFRSSQYKESFYRKLSNERITHTADLLKVSKEALETKLSAHASFNFIEIADAVSLRECINPEKPTGYSRRQRRLRSPPRRGRSRKLDVAKAGAGNRRRRVRKDSKAHTDARVRRRDKRRGNSKRHKDVGSGDRARDKRRKNNQVPKLWAACERNDADSVSRLLAEGSDTEVFFAGWTPLMKAAEDNAVECLQALLNKKADIEACNRKGRTALSFAAAPAARNKPTALAALRILLDHGADDKHFDKLGKTPKERAVMAKRHDAIAIFTAWGL